MQIYKHGFLTPKRSGKTQVRLAVGYTFPAVTPQAQGQLTVYSKTTRVYLFTVSTVQQSLSKADVYK